MKKTLIALALGLMTFQAHAIQSPAWVCSLGFKGRAVGAKLILGSYRFHGHGTLSCVNPTGQHESYPVLVDMHAKPISLGASLGYMELYGQTAEIALSDTSKGPETLLGNYYIAQAQAALIGGAGVITAVHVNNSSLALKVALQLAKGFGVNLGLNRMTISLDQSRMHE